MSAPSSPVPESAAEPRAIEPAVTSATRPFYWSVRRELWENRSIYLAPLAVAAVYFIGFLISLGKLPGNMRAMAALDPALQPAMLAQLYSHAAMLLLLTTLIVTVFYCLDALHGERRDRSILFWKSLPVSDVTTVLSKASIPLVVLPLVIFATTVVLQWIMLLVSSVVLLLTGVGAATQWSRLPLLQMEMVLIYTLVTATLWYAPIYCWLLLVSGWARRAAFLWAVLPPLALGIFERIAFHTSYIHAIAGKRFVGFAIYAFALQMPDGSMVDPHLIPSSQLTPGRLLSRPGLWIGLAVAAVFLAAAVRLRHYREPI
jgi:ABC-2 type transport system permease protein